MTPDPLYCLPAAALMRGSVAALDDLATTPLRKMLLAHMHELWLRPEQALPDRFKVSTLRAGRGWGKTYAIAIDLHRAVRSGEATSIALVAPNQDRAKEIQIDMLLATAPPWFRPVEEKGGLTWPNGVRAEVFTPESPEVIRGGSFSHSWATEILAWPVGTETETKRMRAFKNLMTATRVGAAKIYVDTTARGRNDVIEFLNALNARDPSMFPKITGHMADNPLFDRDYLRAQFLLYVEGSRRFAEEVEGADAGDVAGALWTQETIDRTRREVAPEPLELVLLGLDPAYSDANDADETGLVVGGRKSGHVYVTRDLSKRMMPATWAELAVTTAIAMRAAGIVIEVNSTVALLPTLLSSYCTTHGLAMREIARDAPFPGYQPGVLYVKRITSRNDKATRATGPAAESLADRLHIVGTLEDLEAELTGYDPNSPAKSPGRLDAMVHLVNELANLVGDTPVNHKGDVKAAAEASRRLNAGIQAALGGRRVGM